MHDTAVRVGFGAHAAVRSELGAIFNSARALTQVVWEKHVEGAFICERGILKHGIARNRGSLIGQVQYVVFSRCIDLWAWVVA